MERESFENPEIARLMNDLFVSIKVDREERPDVDDVYMRAVQLLIGRGGWPLTVFLTPERKPFHGGTYFPPVDRHGMPGFPKLRVAVAKAFPEKPVDVARAVGQLVDGVGRSDEVAAPADTLDDTLPRRAADALLEHVDREHGGLGSAPKFPHAPAFRLMLRQYVAGGRPALLDAVTLTTSQMAAGGMRDQIGGGFHRYSVDERWLVPHFEKMLYDNAELPRLYLETFQVTGDPSCRQVVEDTLDYVLREMRHDEGGFFSATDADSEGEEGKFFVWTPDEIAAVVPSEDVDLVCRWWDITPEGNFEHKNIPHLTITIEQLAKMFGRTTDGAAASIASARERLYEARSRRIPPERDEKILTSWNALVIGTLAEAGRVLGVARYVSAAAAAAEFIWTQMRDGDRLLHGWAQGRAKQDAFLDDHAFLASACLDLFEATGDVRQFERAESLMEAVDARFHDDEGGAYFFTPHDGETLIARSKSAADGAIPSGNGTAAVVLLRLHTLTDDERWRNRAEEILRLYHAAAIKNAFGYTTYLEALERWSQGPTEVVVIGEPTDPVVEAMWRVVAERFLPNRILVRQNSRNMTQSVAPARNRPAVENRATAYVCRDFACSRPVTDPHELRSLLAPTTSR
jgi:uncharacterized protein YyaL (SSP411 family)